MNGKRYLLIAILIAAIAAMVLTGCGRGVSGKTSLELVQPRVGDIRVSVSTSGEVEPQNRLEIKPAIAGRVEQILVQEGDRVRKGQNLAWMSSTERAALLDAANSQGSSATAYWEQVYKPMPVISPIDGEVIVRSVEPGQTVATSDAVLVLSDRLIVKAQVDETDIGKIHVGQEAVISLDAYPDIKVQARVDHIAYESTVTNNVTIYEVDILPKTVPPVFRSGMSANVEVITASKSNVMLIPVSAVKQGEKKSFVLVSRGEGQNPERRQVTLGMTSGQDVEVLSGLGSEDHLVATVLNYSALTTNKDKTNPFMPKRPGRNKK